eukprot:CAMPEP_0117567290 /NCGR_PEP_ID=MMETSP0784-20121206/57524_1 /TAXON_ID=39447 /ORGANISM="" /LENGTH=762 /DNA_ID=CAMNT_0005365143 /DNA_START=20 /DNA_END=2306 /DNA_ORIENTATION=+
MSSVLSGRVLWDSHTCIAIQHITNKFVILEDRVLRKLWDVVLVFLLSYTALVFPYRLCFIDYRQPPHSVEKLELWRRIETTVDYLFYIDLFVYFFFTYRNREGNEVRNWFRIVRKYLKTHFVINLVACLPQVFWEDILELFFAQPCTENGCVTKSARLMRLQRASRLLRLMRLFRLAKLCSFVENNLFWRWLQDHVRGVRLFNFFITLFLIVHCLACGWYLVASFEADINNSWLARRVVGPSEETLLSRPGPEQWLHAFYFILTVLTTVGFGDMSALTVDEITYVLFVMLLGAIVHSIVVSEMINIVTSVDECEKAAMTKKALINAYAERTDLGKSVLRRFEYLFEPRKGEVDFDREAIKELFSSVAIPRELCEELPTNIYQGKLLDNRFWRLYHLGDRRIPPRFTILLSVMLNRRGFLTGETVYCRHDHPCNVFLVMSGIFASIAVPTPHGGGDEDLQKDVVEQLSKMHATKSRRINYLTGSPRRAHEIPDTGAQSTPYQLHCWGNYFGDMEIFLSGTTHKYRYATVRCMEAGVTLALGKKDVKELIAEFPDAEALWASVARRRQIAHQALFERHTWPMTHRDVAAIMIQQRFRAIMGNRKHAGDRRPPSAGRAVSQQSGVHVGDHDRIRQLCDVVSSLSDGMVNLRSELRQDVEGLRREMLNEMRAFFVGVHGDVNAPNQSVGDTTHSRLGLEPPLGEVLFPRRLADRGLCCQLPAVFGLPPTCRWTQRGGVALRPTCYHLFHTSGRLDHPSRPIADDTS